jgi:hypothetical protein
MRKKIHKNIRINFIAIPLILLVVIFSNIYFSYSVNAAIGERLELDSVDEIEEGEYFLVSVYDPEDESPSPYLIDVTIEFDGETYQITDEDENLEISIKAPLVSKDTYYAINATKTGYKSDEKEILVINKKLVVTPQDHIVEAGKVFYVTVNDQGDSSVIDATVYIESYGDPATTDGDGVYYLTAPEDREEITINAEKAGYERGYETIRVSSLVPWWREFIDSPYFLIIISIIILLIVIVFVHFRQKRSVYKRANEISKERMIKKYEDEEKPGDQSDIDEHIRVQPNKDAKVEEIRITRPRKEKEVVPVKTEEDKADDVVNRKRIQRRDYDWFEGTDDMRYEIDKLTGEKDEEGMDKWFEGVGNLKDKIDEKVKKKDKKKNSEDKD